MIDFTVINNHIIKGGFDYEIISYEKVDDKYVNINSKAPDDMVYDTSLGANECSINGVIQTSVEQILETIKNA